MTSRSAKAHWLLTAIFAAPILMTFEPFSVVAAQGQTGPGATQPPSSSHLFRLEDGTPVKLRLSRTISSADAHVEDRVDFDILEEVKVNDVVVIPKGSLAWGTVTEAVPKRRMARGGKLDVNIDAVRLANGDKVPLRAVKEAKGGGHTGAMTGAMVATSLVVWPAAPFFLFMHGKDITIPKGTEITAYINGDTNLDSSRFGGKPPAEAQQTPAAAQITAPNPQAPPQAASDNLATVVVKSTPPGADVTVDGKFVGSTPSTVRLAPGDHAISIERSGFKTWQRTMMVSPGGIVTIDAMLEKPI